MDISKSFSMHGKIIAFISIPAIFEYINPDENSLIITEKGLLTNIKTI